MWKRLKIAHERMIVRRWLNVIRRRESIKVLIHSKYMWLFEGLSLAWRLISWCVIDGRIVPSGRNIVDQAWLKEGFAELAEGNRPDCRIRVIGQSELCFVKVEPSNARMLLVRRMSYFPLMRGMRRSWVDVRSKSASLAFGISSTESRSWAWVRRVTVARV